MGDLFRSTIYIQSCWKSFISCEAEIRVSFTSRSLACKIGVGILSRTCHQTGNIVDFNFLNETKYILLFYCWNRRPGDFEQKGIKVAELEVDVV